MNTLNFGILSAAISLPTPSLVRFFGDSNTSGLGVAEAERWSNLLCVNKGWSQSNLAVSASQIADDGQSVTATTITVLDDEWAVWLAGFNDARYYGQNAAAMTDNLAAVLSAAAWLAIPSVNRIPCTDASITYAGGTWTDNGLFGGLKYSQDAGANASFSFTGTSLIIGVARGSTGGNLSVSIDGNVVQTYSCLRTAANTNAGAGASVAAIVVTGLAPGSHSAVLTAATSANTYICWYAALTGVNLGPRVYLAGPFNMPTAAYSMYSPFNNGSDAAMSDYSSILASAAATLHSAGLKVFHIPLSVNTATGFQVDLTHLNSAVGHPSVAAQMEASTP